MALLQCCLSLSKLCSRAHSSSSSDRTRTLKDAESLGSSIAVQESMLQVLFLLSTSIIAITLMQPISHMTSAPPIAERELDDSLLLDSAIFTYLI